ncbi:S41 family peptidase [candidate division KSB1 bacterium]
MKITKKSTILLPLYLAIAMIIGLLIGVKFINYPKMKHDGMLMNFHKYNKVNDVISYIQENYVDSVEREILEESAINGMLSNLDPHSVYIPATDYHDANDILEGNFEGIGVQFRVQDDTIIVIQPVQGGPSEKSGIIAGDRIIKIEGEMVAGIKISNKDVMQRLKGEKGTKVMVSIYRKGVDNLIDLTITRDVIPTYSIDIAYMVNPKIGYVKVSKFSETTKKEFKEAIEKLNNEGMKKLILDLRGNAGGYLKSAIYMSDEFLSKKKLIVYTKGKSRGSDYAYSTKNGMFEENELVVLIDEFSASASEIVAGAIQDNDRGIIIGRKSFGKGLVQEQLPLFDGSAVRLTIARYYTPTGRSIQKSYDKGTEAYYNSFYESYVNGVHGDTILKKPNDTITYTTPEGKIVYGGGGITPDIIVPYVKDEKLDYYNKLIRSSVLYQFCFYYSDKHRDDLMQYENAKKYISKFKISNKILSDLVDFAEDKGIEKDMAGLNYAREKIKFILKAFIGRNIFDDEAFYPLYHKTDHTFIKALQVLEEK